METEGKCSEGHVGEIHFSSVSELARTDDGETLPAVTKPIDPTQPYAGVPRLVRFLRLVGDLSADATLSTDSKPTVGRWWMRSNTSSAAMDWMPIAAWGLPFINNSMCHYATACPDQAPARS